MRLTNRSQLPDALVRAIENDPYDKGNAEFSVTELLKPPRIVALERAHRGELEEDAEDRLWSLYGQIAHTILERANRKGLAEKRFFGTIDGARVSAQIDTLDLEGGVLSDWKFTTAWKFKAGQPAPSDWVAQLNMQLELLRQNGHDATRLQIVGLLRDFSKLEAKRAADYPQASVRIMPIPLWHRDFTIGFMTGRIHLHREAREKLPLCTEDDRWQKPTVYAVMKEGRKTAVKLHDSWEESQVHAASAPGLYVETRAGQAVRCENYCPVSKFCTQFKPHLKGKTEDEPTV